MRRPGSIEPFKPGRWLSALRHYWPITLGMGVLLIWIVASSVIVAWLERKPEYQLRRAVLEGDIVATRTLLAQEVAINHRFPRGYETVLHHAAWRGRPEILRLQLEHGADPNIADATSGETPLHSAV